METNRPSIDFFLGATTAQGFCGYFSQLGPGEGLHLYLLKGGPGCGKSTLMRRLAAQAQQPVQAIHCCSDPHSLDGLILPRQGAAILDATPPHALEPTAPGAAETVISLYDTLDPAKLRPRQALLLEQAAQGKALRAQAARYVGAAAGLLQDNRRIAAGSTDFGRIRRYVKGLADRLLPKTGTAGQEQVRLLSGVTPDGLVCFRDTVPAVADRFYVFHDRDGAAARLAMELLRQEALDRGLFVITCRCGLHPAEKIDHLLLPGMGLAFLTANPWHSWQLPGQKNIHCSRFVDGMHLRRSRSRLHFHRKAADELLAQAIETMAQARTHHHALEALYAPAVDFAAVDRETARCARLLGLAAPAPFVQT